MSEFIVIILDSERRAGEVGDWLQQSPNSELITLAYGALVLREPDGRLQVIKIYPLEESASFSESDWKLLIDQCFLLPKEGDTIGALDGKSGREFVGHGIDNDFIKAVKRAIEPGQSALFLLMDLKEGERVILEPEGIGTAVLRTSLSLEDLDLGQERVHRAERGPIKELASSESNDPSANSETRAGSKQQKPPSRRRLRRLLIIVAGVALFLLLLSLIDLNSLIVMLRATSFYQVFLAVPFLLASFLLLVTGWHYLLPSKVSWREIFHVTCVSFAVSITTPIPDSALRIITTEEGTELTLTEASVALAMERLLIIIMRLIAFIAFLSMWTVQRTKSPLVNIVKAIFIILAIYAIIWIVRHPEAIIAKSGRLSSLPFLHNLNVEEKVSNLTDRLRQTFTVRRFIRLLILYLVITLLSGTFHLLVLNALPINLPVRTMGAISIGFLVMLPPSVPRMIVIYQIVSVTILVALDLLNLEEATAYAVLVQLPQVLLWILLGAYSYRRSKLSLNSLTTKAITLMQDRGFQIPKSP